MKKILSTIIVSAGLCVSVTMPAYAANNLLAAMEAQSHRAVEAAIAAGSIPAGVTVYDCEYGADSNGTTIVIGYRDKNGEWIDILTGDAPKPASGAVVKTVSEADIAKYADRIFELVNEERHKAGKPPLARSDILTAAAATRAAECASLNSMYVDGRAHTRPDGSDWFSVLGIEKNYNYGENTGQGQTAEGRMKRFMKSEGHRRNILREDYTEIGIGCAVSDEGKIFTVQIFYLP